MEWYRSITRETSTGGYQKIGLTLGEEDLKRILVQELPGVPPVAVPVEIAFQLLELETELWLTATGMIRFDYPDQVSGKELISKLMKTKQALLDKLKNSLDAMIAVVEEQLKEEEKHVVDKESGYI